MKTRVLIVGAGIAGRMVADEMSRHAAQETHLVGFVDDDPQLLGTTYKDWVVLGGREAIQSLVEQHQVDLLLLAIPSAEGAVVRSLVRICGRTNAELRVVPGIREVILGDVYWHQVRPFRPDDLLGRESVELEPSAAEAALAGRKVLITGAGGSIGSELSRWACRSRVAQLGLLGNTENELFELEEELAADHPSASLSVELADIRDRELLLRIFPRFGPDLVFHAAAHKHVPLMERHPSEAIKTNVFGTRNVVDATLGSRAQRLVMLSTDKAVNPTSVMGASKRVAEMLLQARARSAATRISMVRFGNVLGSRGSVVPRFQRQIARGGPVTVTDRRTRRYFMTTKEAALLVILAGAEARGGEVFVLDMGQQLSIYELAQEMISATGRKVPIEITGLRPGEKLVEELWTGDFAPTGTAKVHLARLPSPRPEVLDEVLGELESAARAGDERRIRSQLQILVPGFPDLSDQDGQE